MRKRLFLFAIGAVLLTTCSVAHAQWTVFDPVADGYYLPEQQLATLDVIGQNVEQNVNWISQLQHNISEEAHNVQQDITENATYLEAAQIYTTAQSTFKTAVQAYNLANTMYSAPQLLYNKMKTIPTTYKSAFTPHADTYQLAQPLLQIINLGSANALSAYGAMSAQPVSYTPHNLSNMSGPGLSVIQAHASNMSANDSLIATSLQRVSDVQASTITDQQTLATLETNTLTTDSTQATELATLQRINATLLIMTRALEDQNAMATVNQMQHLMESKDALDSQKGDVATWSNWQHGVAALSNEHQNNQASTALLYVPQ
jgi:hypothetical protein